MNRNEYYEIKNRIENIDDAISMIVTSRLALTEYADDIIGRRIYDTLYRGEIKIEDELEELEKLLNKVYSNDDPEVNQ